MLFRISRLPMRVTCPVHFNLHGFISMLYNMVNRPVHYETHHYNIHFFTSYCGCLRVYRTQRSCYTQYTLLTMKNIIRATCFDLTGSSSGTIDKILIWSRITYNLRLFETIYHRVIVVFCSHNCLSRGSSGSTVCDYGLDDRGSIPDRGRGFFFYPLRPDRLWDSPSLLSNVHRGKTRPGRDADHSPPSSGRGKVWVGAIPPLPPMYHHVM
jgi:hypothetical protein